MEIADILHAMIEDSMRSYGLSDLAVGTVVSAKPLKVNVREDMDVLPEEVLWLTEPVIEKKIPVLEHFHSHALPDLGHSHSGEEVDTGSALEGALETEDGLEQDVFDSDKRLLEKEIICYEDGKKLPVKDGFIILNRALEEGDKVLRLRVCRIFERGAQRAAKS